MVTLCDVTVPLTITRNGTLYTQKSFISAWLNFIKPQIKNNTKQQKTQWSPSLALENIYLTSPILGRQGYWPQEDLCCLLAASYLKDTQSLNVVWELNGLMYVKYLNIHMYYFLIQRYVHARHLYYCDRQLWLVYYYLLWIPHSLFIHLTVGKHLGSLLVFSYKQ